MNHSKQYVLKFGGTSVGNPEAIRRAVRVLFPIRSHIRVVVVSAFAGVTDELIRLAELSEVSAKKSLIEHLSERHRSTFHALLPGHEPSDGLESILAELSHAGMDEPKSGSEESWKDYIISFGERLSATIFAYYCNAIGIRASFLDARTVVKTDSTFGHAEIDIDETYHLIQDHCSNPSELFITTGFIGSDSAGQTTTIGRGGSDLTASLFGGALDVDEIQIWTDVSGIYSADPRKIPTAQHFERLTYDQALSLALAGAKVIHPASVYPAKDKNIPVRIKNTFCPDEEGTLISDTKTEISILGLSAEA